MFKFRIWSSSLSSAEDGTSLVEFAIIAPILILLVIGLIEVGRYAVFSIAVINAARAGAQYASQSLATSVDASGITAAATNDDDFRTSSFAVSPSTVTCTGLSSDPSYCPPYASATAPITYAVVTVSDTVSSMLQYPLIPSTFSISSTATMQVINQ